MVKKLNKKIKLEIAKENINFYFNLLETSFKSEYNQKYIKEIQKLSKGFNIRLNREQKLKFCKKCLIYHCTQTRQIRLNPLTKTKDYICKNCGETRKFKY